MQVSLTEKREKERLHNKNLPVYRSAAVKRIVRICSTSHPKDGKQQSNLQPEKFGIGIIVSFRP